MTEILDGKALAKTIREEVQVGAKAFSTTYGRPAALSVVRVGDDPASDRYYQRVADAASAAGLYTELHALSGDTRSQALFRLIDRLNRDDAIDGIMIQMPLPAGMPASEITDRIDPRKDVDGATAESLGRVLAGRPGLVPCTPKGIMALLSAHDVSLRGRHAVVVGRSLAVGRPMAALLLAADATVTQTHSKTQGLAAITQQADLLVVAAGRPHVVGRDMIRPGAVVVDVGIHVTEDGLTGDVDPGAADVAGAITPVPGGVGPVTSAMLLHNALEAATGRMEATMPS